MKNTTQTPLQLGVVIYSACMPVGYLIWREQNPDRIETHPLTGSVKEEHLLKSILKEPVWLITEHGVENIYAEQDAPLFMTLLPLHYRSGNGIAVSKLITAGLTKEELDSWEQELVKQQSKQGTKEQKSVKPTTHVFCPTGPGGGIDPTCGKGGEKAQTSIQALIEKHLGRTERRYFSQLEVMTAKLSQLKREGKFDERRERVLENVLEKIEDYREKVERIEQEERSEKEKEEEEEGKESASFKELTPFEQLEARYQDVQSEAKEPPKDIEEREQHYKQAKPVAARQLNAGTSEVYRVQFEDGTQAIYKPKDGENPALRPNVPAGEYYLREAAAYEIAKELGMQDLVPVTVVRDIPGKGIGVLQEYVPGKDAVNVPRRDRLGSEKKNFVRAAVFNYLIGNTDRHAGNWRLHRDEPGLICLIDHGLSFPINHSTPPLSHFVMVAGAREVKIPKFVQKIKAERIEQILQKYRLADAIPYTMKRLEVLKRVSNFREAERQMPP